MERLGEVDGWERLDVEVEMGPGGGEISDGSARFLLSWVDLFGAR